MASVRTPKWKRILHKYARPLFHKCLAGNYHWWWEKVCYCRNKEFHAEWHGGVGILEHGYWQEYHPLMCDCSGCMRGKEFAEIPSEAEKAG